MINYLDLIINLIRKLLFIYAFLMHYKKIYKKIHSLEREYKILKRDLNRQPLLKSKKNHYLKEDKDEFILFWKRYIKFLEKLKKLLRLSSYRKFFFLINYNKLVLRKYFIHFYYKIISDLLISFWKHDWFIRVFLDENFRRDYWIYAKYIYKPRYINLYNTPVLFIKPFRKYIDKDIFNLIDKFEYTNWKIRFTSDYNNIFFWLKYKFDKLLFIISQKVGYLISHTRFSTRKKWLIKKVNIDKYLEIANPWDIFLSRGNWNATNISIPGFWKHMSMYLWSWEYIKDNYKWDFLDNLKNNLKNNHNYMIEANWDWINILDINDFIYHNDYLWIFRTNFSKD